jgi:hypothetical protein
MRTDDAKTETLQFKVTDQERKLIERCAQDEGTTVSKYVRGCGPHEHGDGWQGRGDQDRGARGRRKSLWRSPTEACPTDHGGTLGTCYPSTIKEAKPVRAACRQAAGRSGMAPVLVTRGRYPQRSVQEFDRFYGFELHPHH